MSDADGVPGTRSRRMWARLVGDDGALGVGLSLLAAALAVALLAPLAWLAFETGTLGGEAVDVSTDSTTIEVLGRSLVMVGAVTAGSVLLGVPLAVLTVQGDLPFGRFWTVVAALPLAIPSYLGAFAAVSAFGPTGELSDALAPYGITIPEVYGLPGAVLVLTLYTYPYVFLTTRASLLSLDASLVEVARTLDCSRLEAFRRVTLPQILPGVAAGALLVALYALSDFGTPVFMGAEVYTQFIWGRWENFGREIAVVLSMHLFVVTVLILAVESSIGADREGAYESHGNRGAVDLELGAWRYVALLLPAAVATLAIALPVGIFATWLTQGGPGYDVGGNQFSWSYAFNSVQVALLAAVASVAVALPIAVRSASGGGWLASLADRASYVGYAAPGVVVGIALTRFSLLGVPDLELYRTMPLLVFAYVVRFVPQAVGSIRTSKRQVDRRLVEAARVLGRSRLGAFRSVTLPLVAPGVATGAALVFLTSMKELPATLMLRPFEFDTLVIYIWRVEELGLYGKAAVPALVLVLISGLSMAVILAGGEHL